MKNSFKFNPWRHLFTFKEQVLLLVLVLGGVCLRTINALQTQVWRDETFIFESATKYSFINLLLQKQWDTAHPPFYFILLHFWSKLGIDPFFLRVPSLLATAVILILVPVVAKKLYSRSKYFPVLALFFYIFSQTQNTLNSMIRPYPFVTIAILFSLLSFVSLINTEKPTLKQLLVFACINVLVIFFDYSGVWLLAGYGFYWLISFIVLPKKIFNRLHIFKGLLFTGLFLSPIAYYLLKNLNNSLSLAGHLKPLYEHTNPILANLWQTAVFAGVTSNDLLVKLHVMSVEKWTFIVVLIACAGLAIAMKRNNKHGLLLLVLAFMPPIVSFTYSVYVSPIFIARNLFITNLVFIFGLALLSSYLFSRAKIVAFIFIGFWAINFFSAFPGLYYTEYPNDWIKLSTILHSYPENQNKYLLTDDAPFMYSPLTYYLTLDPLPQFYILSAKDVSHIIKQPGDTIFVSRTSNTKEAPYVNKGDLENAIEYLKCTPRKISVDFIYFAECKFTE